MTIETISPATGELIAKYEEMSEATAISIIESVHQSYLTWRRLSLEQRAIPVRVMADLLLDRQQQLAELMAAEMGKPLAQGKGEVEKCAGACRHFADHASSYLAQRTIKTEMEKSFVTHEPLGVVFGIMPWNFPLWQVIRFAIPAMMAGNGALLKHAGVSTGTALEIEKLFKEAEFTAEIFRTLIISNDVAGMVISHPHVSAVSFTGSVGTGKIIAAEAGKALKKTVLELGGSDAYVILEDADLELAAKTCVTSRMQNSGQSCIAAKRFIVVDAVHEKFTSLVYEQLQSYVMGSPLDSATNCGPLARRDIRDQVHDQVQQSIKKGATLVTGGVIPDQSGFYYPPTMLTNVKPGMPAFYEEIFGPVVSVITAKNEDEAIMLANDTEYGLGAAVFTKDIAHGEKIAATQLQAGTCVVNTMVSSDSRLPFGGIKHSGYGRELAQEGILSFVNTKTVNIKA